VLRWPTRRHGIGPRLVGDAGAVDAADRAASRAGIGGCFSQINRQLCQDWGRSVSVTAFLGLLDPSAHRINYHSAGQRRCCTFTPYSSLEWLDSSMISFGIDEEAASDGVSGCRWSRVI